MMEQKKRIEEIDYLRGFAILAVIAIHTSTNFTMMQNVNILLIINVIIDIISHFAVPLFIFISGFVLTLNFDGTLPKRKFYKRRAISIIPPYIIFSIIYIVFDIMITGTNSQLVLPSIVKIAFYLITASSSYHLWYIALIAQLYILYPYLEKMYIDFKEKNRTLIYICIILIVQQLWILAKMNIQIQLNTINYFSSINVFNSIVDNILSRIFLSYIFYFVLGIHVSKNYKEIKDKILKNESWIIPTILIITAINSILWINWITKYGSFDGIPKQNFLITSLIGSLYYPLIFSILLINSMNFSNIRNKYPAIISLLGKYSFGIYLIHVFYMRIIVELIYPHFNINCNQWMFYPILFCSTVILSYFTVSQIAHLPCSNIIIGTNNPASRNYFRKFG